MIELPSDITIQTVDETYRQLIEAIRTTPYIVVKLGPNAAIDLAGVQLLIAAREAARDSGGEFCLAVAAENGLLGTLRRGGFLQAADQRAFWLKEKGQP